MTATQADSGSPGLTADPVSELPTDATGVYLVPVPEFARRVGISTKSAYALIHGEVIRPVFYGRKYLVPIAEAERYVSDLIAESKRTAL